MVLVDVKMLSGFTPILSSIDKLKHNGQVMKTDIKSSHVLLYLNHVFREENVFTFSIEQTNIVSNTQPAPVIVYSYYENDEYAVDSYNIPGSQ
ncbi:ovostatin homolog [Psammomys obesus]|uniref:ovostatin homolog n=1 Tax=Psammomys obesus TaxID=48139 RepID=UPI00245347DA|nr:ovostatin homolog [Psammomys obesus]